MEWRSEKFAADPGSIRAARTFVRAVFDTLGVEMADAVLFTGELASNAVEHADTEFEVIVWIGEHTVRIEVYDGVTVTEGFRAFVEMHAQQVDAGSPRGRGLALVRRTALRFGVLDNGESSKAVWFEMALTRPYAPAVGAAGGI